MERGQQQLSFLELWKAQLGYVSGTIIAWGALLLNLWPVLARLQTGAHVRAIGRDEGVLFPATSYYVLALLVAVGLGMLVFGAVHIVARGSWLAQDEPSPTADRTARGTYVIIHVLWMTALALLSVLPLFAVSAYLFSVFTTRFGWPHVVARIVASLASITVVVLAAIILLRRTRSGWRGVRSQFLRSMGRGRLAVAYLTLPVLWLLVIEFSYVVDLEIQQPVLSRSTDRHVVVGVRLGGAIANPSPAQLALSGQRSGPVSLQLRPTEAGHYIAIVPVQSLAAGDYRVTLTYPHGALSSAFPFYAGTIRRTTAFVVVD